MRRDPRKYRPIPARAIKIDLPNTTQVTGWTCGASALLSIASYFGVGPEDEWDYTEDMKFGPSGSDPKHFFRAAEKYGLAIQEFVGMTDEELEACLDRRRPVVLMLQAWPNGKVKSYTHDWHDGHWVIAIGYDKDVFYFEDPSIHGGRGYISRRELKSRWHDIKGPKKHPVRVKRLGLAIWAERVTEFGSVKNARHID
jgi:ABC-type bacteriocin/lantibiotic exporter with double-glycine peptidase domain